MKRSLRFDLNELEEAVRLYFRKSKQAEHISGRDDLIYAEAKKIMILLSGFRRLIREGYARNAALMKVMEIDAAGPSSGHAVIEDMIDDMDSDDDSLVSAPCSDDGVRPSKGARPARPAPAIGDGLVHGKGDAKAGGKGDDLRAEEVEDEEEE